MLDYLEQGTGGWGNEFVYGETVPLGDQDSDMNFGANDDDAYSIIVKRPQSDKWWLLS